MLPKNRTSRIRPPRPTLIVEVLEDRTLLNGVVTTMLLPGSQVLQIEGDSGNNQITIAPSPVPGNIRVSGNAGSFTSVNGVTFADFPMGPTPITDITMTLGTGQDNVTVKDFSIVGELTIIYGNAADVFSTPNFTAATINTIFSTSSLVPVVNPLPSPSPVFVGAVGSGNNSGLLPLLGGGSFGFGSGNTGILVPPTNSGSGSSSTTGTQLPPTDSNSGDSSGSSSTTTNPLPATGSGSVGVGSGGSFGLLPPPGSSGAAFGSGFGSGNNNGLLPPVA